MMYEGIRGALASDDALTAQCAFRGIVSTDFSAS